MAECTIIRSYHQSGTDQEENDRVMNVHYHRTESKPAKEWESIEKLYLPPEILLEIMGYLDFDSIISVSCISSGFYDLYQTDELWRNLLGHDWKLLKEKPIASVDRTLENNNEDGSSSPIMGMNETRSPSSPISYELIDYKDTNDYFSIYKKRYLQYKKWRNRIAFIYSEERKQHMNSVDGELDGRIIGYVKYFLSYPIVFYRLLIFLFISQDEQPDFGLAHEIEYIQEKSLRAGGSLLLLILFLPMLLSIWFIGELPVTPGLATLHVMLKIVFTILCFVSHFYNRMDKMIENYSEANFLSLLIIVTTLISLALMRFVDDFITCCLIAFQMSTALGLSVSLNHMIKNTENIESLFENQTVIPSLSNLSVIFEYFRHRPFGTNMILANLVIIIIMIGGFKTFVFLLIIIAAVVLGGNMNNALRLTDLRTAIFFIVVAVSVCVFTLATNIIGGNYKRKSKTRNVIAIVLLMLLTCSVVALTHRVFSIYFGYSQRWELSFFEPVDDKKPKE